MTRISGNKAIIEADLRPYFRQMTRAQRAITHVTRKVGVRRVGSGRNRSLAFGGKTLIEQMNRSISYPLELGLKNAARHYKRALPASEHREWNSKTGLLASAYLSADNSFGTQRLKKKRLFGVAMKYQALYGAYSTAWVNSRIAPHAHLVEYGTVRRWTKKKQYRGRMPALMPMRNTLRREWSGMVRAHDRSFIRNYRKALKSMGKEFSKNGILSLARPVR